jgi:hypothetical protein
MKHTNHPIVAIKVLPRELGFSETTTTPRVYGLVCYINNDVGCELPLIAAFVN